MVETHKDDLPTIAAVAALAACLAAVAHEAAGHGGACLALGGRVALLTNVYFRCAPPAPLVDLAGPLGNLALAAAAFLALTLTPAGKTVARLFLTLLFAFSTFWLAGLLLVCGLTGDGDAAFWARETLTSTPPAVWRAGLTVLGVGFYVFGIVATTRLAPPGPALRLRTAWLAGAAAVTLAALAWKGSPLAGTWTEGVIEAVKTIAVAALPLWFLAEGAERRAGAAAGAAPVERSWGWIGASAVGVVAFVAMMGRGLPW